MTKDLTRGTPWKLILQFALPIMAGNLLQQLYNTADTIIVGNFNGQQALSAVGACAALTVLFTALAIGFSIGAGVLISQYFGASRERELRQYAATAIVLMLAMGLFMSLAGVVSARFLLERVLGTPEALLPKWKHAPSRKGSAPHPAIPGSSNAAAASFEMMCFICTTGSWS